MSTDNGDLPKLYDAKAVEAAAAEIGKLCKSILDVRGIQEADQQIIIGNIIVALIISISKGSPPKQIRAWTKKVLHDEVADYYSDLELLREHGSQIPTEFDSSTIPEPPQEVAFEKRELATFILSKLSPRQRKIVFLYKDDRTIYDVAGIMGISKTVIAAELQEVRAIAKKLFPS